jgi:hypothetical protein
MKHKSKQGVGRFYFVTVLILILQRDFIPTGEVVLHVVFDASDTPHDYALGGIVRPPTPSRGRIPV